MKSTGDQANARAAPANPAIFLSYAKEDQRRVQNIYRHLRQAGLNPWMDHPPHPWSRDGLIPGQEWDTEIRRKLNEAALVLLFLSRISLAKRGYVQRESVPQNNIDHLC